jgi:hypothetical protein
MEPAWPPWAVVSRASTRRSGRHRNNSRVLIGGRQRGHDSTWNGCQFGSMKQSKKLSLQNVAFFSTKWMSGAHCMTPSVISLSLGCHYMTLSVISLYLIDGIQEGVSSNNEFECGLRPR